MSLAYSYVRFSTKRQLEGDSLLRQTEAGDEWIRRHGHTPASLTLHDLGVPAYRGQNKHRGALKHFLELMAGGQIGAGSVLVIENLDRLSRQGVGEAYDLFRSILRDGVSIAVLKPFECLYTADSLNDLVGLLLPLIYFHLAYIESRNKSERLKKVWEHKRQAATNGVKFDRCRPSWLDWDGTHFVKNAGAAAIEFIFRQTAAGLGQREVLAGLQRDYKPIGRSGRWNRSFVSKVLLDRAVVGERQPHSFDNDGQRVPNGKPLPGYYPAVIDEALWDLAQAARRHRRRQRGPSGKFVNLFVGLLFNAHDKSRIHVQTCWSERQPRRRLVSERHLDKVAGSDSVGVTYSTFEEVVLRALGEVELTELENPAALRAILALEHEHSSTEARLGELHKAVTDLAGGSVKLLASGIARLDKHRLELADELAKRHRELLLEAPLLRLQAAIRALLELSGDQLREARLQVRTILPDLVESIWLKPEKHYGRVYCLAQLFFRGGIKRCVFFGPGFAHTERNAPPSIDRRIDLRDQREAQRQVFGKLARVLVHPVDPKLPTQLPSEVGAAADVWLQVMRSKLPYRSYRTIPPKLQRLVKFLGEDLLVTQVNPARWAAFVAWLNKEVRDGELAITTARVTHNRCRQFAVWLGRDLLFKSARQALA